jgi:hypothetical protein
MLFAAHSIQYRGVRCCLHNNAESQDMAGVIVDGEDEYYWIKGIKCTGYHHQT